MLPLRPGLPEKATHDDKRNGTTTLLAALELATGKVTDRATTGTGRYCSGCCSPPAGPVHRHRAGSRSTTAMGLVEVPVSAPAPKAATRTVSPTRKERAVLAVRARRPLVQVAPIFLALRGTPPGRRPGAAAPPGTWLPRRRPAG